MKGIKYIGPIRDYSGYSEAARNYILALHKAGVPITVQPHCFDVNPPAVGSSQEWAIINSLVGAEVDYDVVIVHLTPDLAPLYKEKYKDKYVISYTVWETDKLHPYWTTCCNKMDEVWVPSSWNVESFRNSGVNVPIHLIPHGIAPDTFLNTDKSAFSLGSEANTFNFYSIFQWNARKNGEGLLRAYFNAFKGQDDVRLILKTYIGGGLPAKEELKVLKEKIYAIKNDMRLDHFPKLTLISEPLSTEQVRALHLYGDAYVALPHGEGWGLVSFEAGLAGKPVITTNGGGQLEYLNKYNSYLVDSRLTYVSGMGTFNPWYLGDQKWYEPSLLDASNKMREVYEDFSSAQEKGRLLKGDIVNNFSWDEVASMMVKRLQEI